MVMTGGWFMALFSPHNWDFSPRHASLAKPPGLPGVDPWPVPVVLQDDGLATGIGRKCEDLLFSWRMGSHKVMERDRDVGKKHLVCICFYKKKHPKI
jgi:hypothetical protein